MGKQEQDRVFLSYRRDEGMDFCNRVLAQLNEAGVSAWRDVSSVEGGLDWWEQIERSTRAAEYMLLLITPNYFLSKICRKEWEFARREGIRIIPVVEGDPDVRLLAGRPRWLEPLDVVNLANPERLRWLLRCLEGPPGKVPRIPMMAAPPPRGAIDRPGIFRDVRRDLLDAVDQNTSLDAALCGTAGFGKTTLARMLCADAEIQEAFDDGILWVTLGEEPGELLRRTIALIEILLPDERGRTYAHQREATDRLSELLENKRVLLVIDDVWKAHHAAPFLEPQPRVCRLITTRNRRVLQNNCRIYSVDKMAPDEATTLLTRDLDAGPDEVVRLEQLADDKLLRWPLLLALVNRSIFLRVRDQHSSLSAAIDRVQRVYEKRGVTGFDAYDAQQRNEAVKASLEVGFESLASNDAQRLSELAVFPEDVLIPTATVELLWHYTARLDDIETEDVLTRLSSLSLLGQFDMRTGHVTLHDVYREHFRRQQGEEGMKSLNTAIVSAYRAVCPAGWAKGPDREDDYYWHHFAGHLAQSDWPAYERLVTSIDWLSAKLSRYRVAGLLEDFGDGSAQQLMLVRDAIELSAHALERDPDSLPSQLYNRLHRFEHAAIRSLCDDLSRYHLASWLRPLSASVTPPGNALKRTLSDHTWVVLCAAGDASRRRLVTGSGDGTVRLWDLVSGRQLHWFQHGGVIDHVALSSDGRTIASSSSDWPLKIWSADSGDERFSSAKGEFGMNRIGALALAHGGATVVSLQGGGTLKRLDLQTANERTLATPLPPIGLLAQGDDASLVLALDDASVVIMNIDTGIHRQVLPAQQPPLTSLALSPDGATLVGGQRNGIVRAWTTAEGALIGQIQICEGAVSHVSVGAREVLFAVDADGRRLVAIDQSLKNVLCERSVGDTKVLGAGPDGTAITSLFNVLQQWDMSPGRELTSFCGHRGSVNSLAVSIDGEQAYSIGDDHVVRVWSTADGAERGSDSSLPAQCVAAAPNGHILIGGADGSLTLLGGSLRSVRWTGGVDCGFAGVQAVACAQDQPIIAVAARKIYLSKNDAWQPYREEAPNLGRMCSIDFTPDGKYVLVACQMHRVYVVPTDAGVSAFTLDGHGGYVEPVAALPDSRRCVTGSDDMLVRLWDIHTRSQLAVLEGHTGWVRSITVFGGGRYVASGGFDQTVRIWDLESLVEVARLHTDSMVTALAANVHSNRLTVAEMTGRVHFFEYEP